MPKTLARLAIFAFQISTVTFAQDNLRPSVTCPFGVARKNAADQEPGQRSLMTQDCLWSDGKYNIATEGLMWPKSTYAWLVVSRTMTPLTVSGQGHGTLDNGPLTSLYVMASNDGATGHVVPLITSCRVQQDGGVCFGGNDLVRNEGRVSAQLIGREIDLMFATGSTDAGGSIGQPYNVFNIASDATVSLVGGINGGTWANGHVTSAIRGAHYSVALGDATTSHSFINTTNGDFSDGAILLGQGVTQALVLGGRAFATSPYLYGDKSNNLVLNLGSGGYFVVKDPQGTTQMTLDRLGNATLNSLNISKASTPASSSAPCKTGDQSWDANYMYICVRSNSWRRTALNNW